MKPLHTHCLRCKKEFTDEFKERSKGNCHRCYSYNHYVKRRDCANNNIKYDEDGKRIITENCLSCGGLFGGTNKRGKPIKKASSQYCRTCYARIYRKVGGKKCDKCGDEILDRTTKSLCKRCYVPIRDMLSSKEKKDKLKNARLDKHILEAIRLIIVRYKFGGYDPVDHFRLVDLYLSVMGEENLLNGKGYDNMEMEGQIIYMLKDLKQIYDKNKAMS